MEPVLIVAGFLLILVLIVLLSAVKVVPQASVMIVERFGRYARTLNAGLHVVVPLVSRVRVRIDLREQVVPFPPQPVITRDNLVVNIDTVIYYQVTDPRAATYEVASYIQAIEQLTVTTLRTIIGSMDLEVTLTSREVINAGLRGVLDEGTGKWGIRVNRVELKAIEPPTSIQDSMEKQMRADRDKRAAILTAEGQRQAAILRAEGEKQATLLKAEGDREAAAIRTRDQGGPSPAAVPAQARPASVHQPLRQGDPRQIGRYQLTARLGEGGMGTVFLGLSPGQRLVAVKVVRPDFATDPEFLHRFAREIDAASRVGGFHTAPVVDADSRATPPWLATEYIPGPSLHEVLRRQGALPARTVHVLALGVAEALERIHACGIIHRDLKPSNIIVSAAGPRVIDFGIARSLDGTVLTGTNIVVGTQGFLAPEQLTGGPVTPASDLYAFGLVLCHAAGALPLGDGESLESALALLPSHFAAVIRRCLDHAPERRPTPTQILDELSRYGASSEGWLPPSVRTMVDLHSARTVTAP